MNRSIMIVICDFIVLSMLSIFAVKSGDGYASGAALYNDHRTLEIIREELVIRENILLDKRNELLKNDSESAELSQLREELVSVRRKLQHIDYQLALSAAVAGELTGESVRKKLENESREKLLLQGQYEETANQLAQLEKDLAALSESGAHEIARREREIAQAKSDLQRLANEITASKGEIDDLSKRVRNLSSQRDEDQKQLAKYELELSSAKKNLGALQNELLAGKGHLAQLNRRASSRESELEVAKRELDSLRRMLKKAVNDLASARTELESLKKSVEPEIALVSELPEIEPLAAVPTVELEFPLEPEWRKLECNIRESGWVFDRNHHSENDLIALSISGGEYLIGSVGAVFGQDLDFGKVSRLNFGIYDSKMGDGTLYNEQIYFAGSDLVLFRNPLPVNKAMAVAGVSEFRARSGEAFLRRIGRNGGISLSNRLQFAADGTLTIDNRKFDRDNRARQGDFITIGDKFAGMVVTDGNNSARCALFPDRLELLPVTAGKVDRNGYFSEFTAAMKKLKK